ncbi:MAG TPA: hypothetical protein VFD30_01060 [Terriglobia bacterium]|jgi:hypothetical protein|nr:hypothetical protein [Terriglobia bacterium]
MRPFILIPLGVVFAAAHLVFGVVDFADLCAHVARNYFLLAAVAFLAASAIGLASRRRA